MFIKTYKLLLLCAIILGTTFSQNNPVKIIQNGDASTTYQGQITPRDNAVWVAPNPMKLPPESYDVSSTISFVSTELSTDARTVYDLQSNGCVRYIWQNPTNPTQLHAIFTVSTDPAAWPDRNVRYFYSTNTGTSWDYLGLVSTSRAGFGSLSALTGTTTNGRAIVATHTANAPSGDVRTQVFVDLAPGAGTWTARDPGISAGVTIWPSLVSTTDNRALLTSSLNPGPGLFRNRSTALTAATTWDGWTAIPDGQNANQSAVARWGDTLGIAYLTTDLGISYMQSNNNGVTWGAPTVVRAYTPADSNGTLRSVDMVFQNGQPRVIFGICKIIVAGFFPTEPSYLYTWSPTINGGTPVLLDSSLGLKGTGNHDVYTSVARGVLGRSVDGQGLYASWCRARLADTSAAGIHFFDVWFAYSTNGGATWTGKTRFSNISGPLRDNRWVSISPTNNGAGTTYIAYLVHQRDSIPGTYVNMGPLSTSYMIYTRVTLLNEIGITPISGEIPNQFALHQNFPNPFNPTTNIRFDLPKNGFVTLKVYNAMGQEVATLINENLNAGVKQYDWNAIDVPSGVYFYTLTAGDFKETKKMILVK